MFNQRYVLCLLCWQVFFAFLYADFAYSNKTTYGDVVVQVGAVYDGDTFRVTVEGWPSIVGENMPVRISGIDTPEFASTEGSLRELAKEARTVLQAQLRSAEKVELKNMRRDKYFRIVADVFADGTDVGQMMLDRKLAKRYDGGTKPKWSQDDVTNYLDQK